MDRPSLYDDDIVTWSEEQAAALRALARRPDLSNTLDWEMVIEEIETVGRSEIDKVESALLLVLVHVLKYLSAPSAQSTASWRTEVITFQASAQRSYRRSMRQRIDGDHLWALAKKRAASELAMFGDSMVGGLPTAMPFTLEDLASRDFTMDAALERLAAALVEVKLAERDERH